jgi:hypothetical protein
MPAAETPRSPAPEGTLTRAEADAQVREVRAAHTVEVREPLVLISQISRSGGTLLSQLLDAHPELHSHPHELKIGHPDKQVWPDLDLGAEPAAWFELLFESTSTLHFQKGYLKSSRARSTRVGPAETFERFPFIFLADLQRELFLERARTSRPSSEREVLDWYMTSFFNAWIDNQNLYEGRKRWVVGFTPGLHAEPGSLDRFFAVYPDGRLVSIVRDPATWYASARWHNERRYGDLDSAVGQWLASTQATVSAKARWPAESVVLRFEDLLLDTERVMRQIAASLGIEFRQSLLEPTFNGFPIRANSTEPVGAYGVLEQPVLRAAELEPGERARIEELTADAYERAVALAER